MTYVDEDTARAVGTLGALVHTMDLPGTPSWKRTALAWEIEVVVSHADAAGIKVQPRYRDIADGVRRGEYALAAVQR